MNTPHISPAWAVARIAFIIVAFWAAAQLSSCLPRPEHIIITAASFVAAAYLIWKALRHTSPSLPNGLKLFGWVALAVLIVALLLNPGKFSVGSSERDLLLSGECVIVAWLLWCFFRRR
jgi:hypothetical protein